MADAGTGTPEARSWWNVGSGGSSRVDLKTDIPHSARMYDYFLGGKDHFAADRAAAEEALRAFPDTARGARQNRAFLVRATRHLAGALGIRQFLDIGTGIPTSPNLHEVAQEIAPECRVVYVDNDPIVLAHARALLTSSPEGETAYLDADFRDPERILTSPEVLGTLDLTRPVALSLITICHFVADEDDPYGIVRRLPDALPAGSALALTHFTADFAPEQVGRLANVYRRQGISVTPRDRAQVTRFFDGLDLVEPGVAALHSWRPDGAVPDGQTDAQSGAYGGLARKL